MVVIPTISQLQASIIADLEAQFNTSIPAFIKTFLRAIAFVQAAKLKIYYLALDNVQKNVFPDSADSEFNGGTLQRFGRIKLGRNPFSATQGQYEVSVTGTAGSVINSGQQFKSDSNSLNPDSLFVLDDQYICTGTGDTITLRSLTGGVVHKQSVGNVFVAVAPILNVNSSVTVLGEVVSPIEAETDEEYRLKILESFRLEPTGGSSADYRLWSKDAAGVKQSYPFAWSGHPNEINIYVEANPADSTDGYGTPTGTIITDVDGVIEFDPDTTKPLHERGRRPLGLFDYHVLPVTPLAVDIEIQGYVGLTVSNQAIIESSIIDFINTVRPYVAACDIVEDKNDILDSNKIVAVIVQAVSGSTFGTIGITVDGTPTPSYTFANGNIPYFNSLTFV